MLEFKLHLSANGDGGGGAGRGGGGVGGGGGGGGWGVSYPGTLPFSLSHYNAFAIRIQHSNNSYRLNIGRHTAIG